MIVWRPLVVATILATVAAINRPVYKVILTQKGFTQFIRYDLEMPVIREFTFCSWFRVYSFLNDQTLFSYVVNGNSRVVRLWVDSGGQHLVVSIKGHVGTRVPVDLGQEAWRHVCLSYQSDFGAWALYIDSRLATCEAPQELYGYLLPARGSVVLGYGVSDEGTASGFEGEIFGANMILTSTIQRNNTLKNNPKYRQKYNKNNHAQSSNKEKYVILNNLDSGEISNHENPKHTLTLKQTKFMEEQVGQGNVKIYSDSDFTTTKIPEIENHTKLDTEKENLFDYVMDTNRNQMFEKNAPEPQILKTGVYIHSKNPITRKSKNIEQLRSATQDLLTVSEYETPPSQSAVRSEYFDTRLPTDMPPAYVSNNNNLPEEGSQYKVMPLRERNLEKEYPPPPVTDNKVYGQWVSSKYAGNVLNYLKSINLHIKPKRVPNTIPLTKVSDNYPYPSEMKYSVLKPPTNLRKKIYNTNRNFKKRYVMPLDYDMEEYQSRIHKRAATLPEVNVKILEEDIRREIMDHHARTEAKNVGIFPRGFTHVENKTVPNNHRVTRNYDEDDDDDDEDEGSVSNTHYDTKKIYNSLFNVLPFLKSVEYFTGDLEETDKKEEMYTKSFSMRNKWHNVKSYNNDFTPRRNFEDENINSHTNEEIANINKKHPSIRLKYQPETNKIVKFEDESIIKGRELAAAVSNPSGNSKDKISLLKYNHGFLPNHEQKKADEQSKSRLNVYDTNNFNTRVKIGNALNEQHVIRNNEESSFIGEDSRVPDINKYRSDIDNVHNDDVPPSLQPAVCNKAQLYDNTLYIHPDGSIDMTRIMSPVKSTSEAISFILQNYKKCSLEDSFLDNHPLLVIHWSKTPVRLFGGAVAKKTKDLCGFF